MRRSVRGKRAWGVNTLVNHQQSRPRSDLTWVSAASGSHCDSSSGRPAGVVCPSTPPCGAESTRNRESCGWVSAGCYSACPDPCPGSPVSAADSGSYWRPWELPAGRPGTCRCCHAFSATLCTHSEIKTQVNYLTLTNLRLVRSNSLSIAFFMIINNTLS